MNPYLAKLRAEKMKIGLPREPSKPSKGAFEGFEGAPGTRISKKSEPQDPDKTDSDTSGPDLENTTLKRESPSTRFLHPCQVCGEWGSFGYGVSLRAGRLGQWYCFAHRPAAAPEGA
jgi:hypothetical protein